MVDKTNGWNEWSKHVLLELERLNTCYSDISKEMNELKIEIASFKIEKKFYAGMWGLIGGIVPVLIMILYLAVSGG